MYHEIAWYQNIQFWYILTTTIALRSIRSWIYHKKIFCDQKESISNKALHHTKFVIFCRKVFLFALVLVLNSALGFTWCCVWFWPIKISSRGDIEKNWQLAQPKGIYHRLAQIIHPDSCLSIISLPYSWLKLIQKFVITAW